MNYHKCTRCGWEGKLYGGSATGLTYCPNCGYVL